MNKEELKYDSGYYKQQFQHKSFMPSFINKPFLYNDSKINMLLEEARGALGELNAYSELIPDIEFYINMHIAKEASDSNRIEGTKTQIDEALIPEEEVSPEKKDDYMEVKNYIDALNEGVSLLDELPLSTRLVSKIHQTLLCNVRGKYKLPGQIRKTQNWTGGSSIKDAFYIPPNSNDLPELLSDWEKFINNDNLEIPELIKIALAHYQFETIHPFLGGNGRIGRLLIILHLIKKKFLNRPTLYISSFFVKNKGSYYDALTLVREAGNIEHWIKFFLNGVLETSKNSLCVFRGIIEIKSKYEAKIMMLGARAKLGQDFMNILYSRVTVNVNEIATGLKINYPRAKRLLDDFIEMGVLVEIDNKSQRNRRYCFKEYLLLFMD